MMGWMAPLRHLGAKVLVGQKPPANREPSMNEITTIGSSSGACERAMTRDDTVGRSDATERNLALRWEVDPVRMMTPQFANSIRASSRFRLHPKAGHMTASDLYAARQIISCQAGAIPT